MMEILQSLLQSIVKVSDCYEMSRVYPFSYFFV
ncbi:MAG: hypothetical protein ACI9NY_001847, partial [Kiritimatiellia bacterium]